ncbi:BLOC-2 complex member HPS6-like [Paramormyrops kingsleyae]|uniref:BLOC-2 complex member HPS6-like n=1 Tax=Paramormyrops kingsleyae TaxID=1676925 RepID=UPI000CD651B8|nr:Hermansky-Pudlak syndrome 6 protein homolog [Paramormyrops kingsleyae]
MKRLVLHQETDFSDFTQGRVLIDFLKQNSASSICYTNNIHSRLSNIRISPNGHHIHIIISEPKSGLLTFDKHIRHTQSRNQKLLVLSRTRSVYIVDVVYLNNSSRDRSGDTAVVVFENGKSDFWKYCEQEGWHFLQTMELCQIPKAKVKSICASSNIIVWCEETPPSKSTSAINVHQNCFCYRICSRSYELEEGAAILGEVKVILHNSPRYMTVASGNNVHLLPDPKGSTFRNISGFFLTWFPQCGSLAISSISRGILLMKESCAMSDGYNFTELISLAVPLASNHLEICAASTSRCDNLSFLLSSGWINMIDNHGTLRQVYKLAHSCSTTGGKWIDMNIYHNWLAVIVGKTLYLIDAQCGLKLEKILLKTDGMLYVNCQDSQVPHILTEAGLFQVKCWDQDFSHVLDQGCVRPDDVLMKTVFEESCRHYQKRSLSDRQITVETLLADRKFQAPFLLSSILCDFLKVQDGSDLDYGQLLSYLKPELKRFMLLDGIKMLATAASEKDQSSCCEVLVCEEVGRLLSSDMEREDVLHLNLMFNMFPSESWQATQGILQLQLNEEGSFSAKVPLEVWRTILSSVQPLAWPTHQGIPPAVPVPVFELLCQMFLRYQPQWLPRFLELAQQCSGDLLSTPSRQKAGPEETPLYKRALSVLPLGRDSQGLEVELLLCSCRPTGILQALRLLVDRRQWEQVLQLAERFCQQSPLLNKEIFTTLLQELSQHRDLDPYLDRVWALCPADITSTGILSVLLESFSASIPSGPQPFQTQNCQLTLGLLRPLLSQVLQKETKVNQGCVRVLWPRAHPPPVPPRRPREMLVGSDVGHPYATYQPESENGRLAANSDG